MISWRILFNLIVNMNLYEVNNNPFPFFAAKDCLDYQQTITEALKITFCAQSQGPTDYLKKFYAQEFQKGLTKGLIEALPAGAKDTKDKLAAFKSVTASNSYFMTIFFLQNFNFLINLKKLFMANVGTQNTLASHTITFFIRKN